MDLIEIGASFDWISPVLSIAGDIVNGGGHHFAVSTDCGWSGRDITRLLKDAGIKSWGHMVVSDSILFSVRKQDAAEAQAILQQNGITIESKTPKGYKEQGKGKDKQGYQPGKGWSLFE